MLAGLQLPDKNHDSIILGFVHVHPISGGNIVVFKITVSPSGFGGHRVVVADHTSSCVVTYWRMVGDARFRQMLTDPAVYNKGVAIVPRVACPKIDKILTPRAACSRL